MTDVNKVIDSLSRKTMAPGMTYVARPTDIRDSLYVPASWPAVTEMFVGNDGAIWLRQPQPPSRLALFWRIDAKGKPMGTVAVGSDLRILRVTADKIWAAGEDTDGSPTVEVHRIVRN